MVLSITGVEALYADMGHFGKFPIRPAWFTVVLPSLVLNYFGQGALLLKHPEAIKNPFFLLAPDWALIPLLILAALATVIASQAVISGVFSLTRQAVRLGYLSPMRIIHTSEMESVRSTSLSLTGCFISRLWLLLLALSTPATGGGLWYCRDRHDGADVYSFYDRGA